jgi:hypothetical protein
MNGIQQHAEQIQRTIMSVSAAPVPLEDEGSGLCSNSRQLGEVHRHAPRLVAAWPPG